MPIYRNDSPTQITVTDYMGEKVTFYPNQEITTLKILDDVRLTLTSDEPMLNILISDETFTLGTSATSASMEVDPSSIQIRLFPIDDTKLTARVFINDWSNTPGITVCEGISVINKGKVDRLYLLGPGTVNVKVFNTLISLLG